MKTGEIPELYVIGFVGGRFNLNKINHCFILKTVNVYGHNTR